MLEGFKVYDDIQGPPASPEAMTAIKAWFDEMVESGRIKVLTVKTNIGTVTFITTGEVPLADREGD
jgi:hypothetical protein